MLLHPDLDPVTLKKICRTENSVSCILWISSGRPAALHPWRSGLSESGSETITQRVDEFKKKKRKIINKSRWMRRIVKVLDVVM